MPNNSFDLLVHNVFIEEAYINGLLDNPMKSLASTLFGLVPY